MRLDVIELKQINWIDLIRSIARRNLADTIRSAPRSRVLVLGATRCAVLADSNVHQPRPAAFPGSFVRLLIETNISPLTAAIPAGHAPRPSMRLSGIWRRGPTRSIGSRFAKGSCSCEQRAQIRRL